MMQCNPLVPLIERRASLMEIVTALSDGADANDVEVMQALEAIAPNDPWLSPVLALPAIEDACWLRSDADQAALDLSVAIEKGDVDSVADALARMREAGDTADMTSCDLTFLGEAVACRAPLAIIELLLENEADPDDMSSDAREELVELPEDAWRASVEQAFMKATAEPRAR